MPTRLKYGDLKAAPSAPRRIKYDDLLTDQFERIPSEYEASFGGATTPVQPSQTRYAFESGEPSRDWVDTPPVRELTEQENLEQRYAPMIRNIPPDRRQAILDIQAEGENLPFGEAVLSAYNAAPRGLSSLFSGGLKSLGMADEELNRMFSPGQYVANPEQHPLYRAGKAIEEVTTDIFPRIPRAQGSFVAETLPEAAGQMAGFVGTGGLARVFFKYGPEVVAVMLGSGLEATEIYERARRSGVSSDDASLLARLGIPIGALELLGIPRIIRAFGGSRNLKQVFKHGLFGTGENAFQEIAQGGLENAVAKAHSDAEIFEGVGQAGAAGGILGGLMTLGAAYLGLRMRNRIRKDRVSTYKAQRASKQAVKALQTDLPPSPGQPVAVEPETPVRSILTPEGASQFAADNPEAAAKIAAKDQPSRTDVLPTGEKLEGPERAQLSKLLREGSAPPAETRPEPAAELPVPPVEPANAEIQEGQTQAEAPVLETARTPEPSPGRAMAPATARQRLKAKANEARKRRAEARYGPRQSLFSDERGSIDPQALSDYAIIGADIIADIGANITEFTKRMVAEFGEGVRTNIQQIYDEAAKEYDEATINNPPTGIAEGTTVAPEPKMSLNLAGYPEILAAIGREGTLEPNRSRRLTAIAAQAKQEGYDQRAETIALELLATKRAATPLEYAGMAFRVADLRRDHRATIAEEAAAINAGDDGAALAAKNLRQLIEGKIFGLVEASERSGGEASDALNIRRMVLNWDTDDISFIITSATKNKGAPLTTEESQNLQQLQKELADLKEKFAADYEKHKSDLAAAEKRAAEAVADREIRREARRKTNTERIAKIRDKRANLYKQLAAMGYQVNMNVDPKALWMLGQVAQTYIEEGATSLDDVVQKMIEKMPDLSARDVWDAMVARDPDAKKRAESQAKKVIRESKAEAELLRQVGDAINGIFRPGRKPREIRADIAALKKALNRLRPKLYQSGRESHAIESALKRIAMLQDQLSRGWRSLKKVRGEVPEDLQIAREKIKELETHLRLTDKKADYEEQLRTRQFKVTPKKTVKRLPSYLERLQVEVNQARKKIDRAIEDMKPKGKLGLLKEATDLMRQIKATADMSYTLRQLAFFTIAHPIQAIDAHINGVKAFFSQNSAESIDAAMRAHPMHYLRQGRMGIQFSELDNPSLRGEEYYHSKVINWFERKFPKLGQVFRSSSRHATVAANMFRASLADEFMANNPNATDDELKAYGDVINKGTGIGSIGGADWLAYVLFAPKFTASRFQAPATILKYWKYPRVRREIIKNIVADVSTGMGVLLLASMAGLKVGYDPRDPDFGKIVWGNQHIDIWAGFQQPARLILRLMMKAGGAEDRNDIRDIIARFISYKSSPALSLAYETVEGKTLVGEETAFTETAIRAMTPLILEELYDAARIEGPGGVLLSGILNFYGVGANTYIKEQARGRQRRRRTRRSARN